MSTILPPIFIDEISNILLSSQQQGLLDKNDTSIIFLNLSKLKERITYIKSSFPKNVYHTVAIKTNPLLGFLKECIKEGIGLEAASMGEVEIALAAGAQPNQILFDSPAKTIQELKKSIEYGVHINADNFDELARINKIIKHPGKSTVALRINPQIGMGKIAELSTAGEYSKFGVPIKYCKDQIIDSFKKYPWLTGIHVHSGSQGMNIGQLIGGIKVIYDLCHEINSILNQEGYANRIDIIDIGGGLPFAYKEDEISCDVAKYAKDIAERCPDIFTSFKILTEFGRFYSAPIGWVMSTVEYIKQQPNKNIAVVHVGADLFLRECYTPEHEYHKFSVLDAHLTLKNKNISAWDIAGPLCFSGDVIGRNITLPNIETNDHIIIHDTGANTINLWSRHCSRNVPKVIGYYNNEDIFILKAKETFEDIIRFWGG